MFISIEGCHGVGKTVVCKLLAQKNHWSYTEELKDNLLPPPKIGPEGDVFLSQFWFLRQQILKEYQINTNSGVYISDRSKTSVYIYSKVNMNDYQFEIFKTVLQRVDLKEPDIEIIMHAPDNIIYERARERGRIGWSEEQRDYLAKINQAFLNYYEAYKGIKKVHLIDASGSLNENMLKIEIY